MAEPIQNFALGPPQSFEKLMKERLQNRVAPAGLVVTNKDGPQATIRIYDEIGWFGITAEEFARELEEVTADEIEVQISSLGGDVFDGIAIYNALRAHPATITTRVDSMAASIASVIAQAGDHRIMLTGSQMMIHEAAGLAIGNAAIMRELADILDKQTGIIANIYAERADGDRDLFLDQMAAETWFDHDEAVEAGLADEVVKPVKQPTARSNGSLTQHIAAAVKVAEDVSDRVAEVVTLRTDQGKSTDDSWQTREEVDRLAASLNRLVAALTPDETEASEGHGVPEDDAQIRLAALRERVQARQEVLAVTADRLKGLA
jgi:ATP-dependent protease ClpP protease subunit